MSTNPMNKGIIKSTKLNHQKITRVNTPGTIPPIIPPKHEQFQVEEAPIPVTTNTKPRRSACLSFIQPIIISQKLVNFVTLRVWNDPTQFIPRKLHPPPKTTMMDEHFYEHMAVPVVNPTTGETISNYRKLAKDPELKETWLKAFEKELGYLAQGDELTNTPNMDTIFFVNLDKIQQIPKDRTITYAHICC